jgi:aminoglycoside 3-N-acetyltransferase
MITFRGLVSGFREMDIHGCQAVIAHASLSAFEDVRGGAETIIGAVLSSFNALMMPAFTYKTMLIPEDGPEDNASKYGSGKDTNKMAEFFTAEMPVDRTLGVVAEALRLHPGAVRSTHPILSFSGIGVDDALQVQNANEPFAPIGKLADQQSWVLLLGVDHTVNTSIHFVEKLAGRKQFIRWALTPDGVVECQGFPGCSMGFSVMGVYLESVIRRVQIGTALVQAIPLDALIDIGTLLVRRDPLALLCTNSNCERCQSVRQSIA